MVRANKPQHGREPAANRAPADDDEDVGLLAAGYADDDDGAEKADRAGDDGEDRGHTRPAPPPIAPPPIAPQQRTPRTPNRVRFDLTPTVARFPPANGSANGSAHRRDDDDDSSSEGDGARESFDLDSEPEVRGSRSDARPLLTDIEAPSIALANSPWGRADDGGDWAALRAAAEEERARPKSGLRAAFMNMANSIIGAGIIGQPYAFKQAGLLSGVVLLVALTFAVDWTIRLIVVNSKLSGASSFQGTVERCFGRPGLVAISLAQWVFAFGGMVAFGVIVGDSIPHVLTAVWPGLPSVPVLGLLADRRAVIVVFVLGVSYPLTLYRDIAKLAWASTLALVSMVVIIVTVVVQGALAPRDDRGSFSRPLLTVNSGIFQAIGVISFGKRPPGTRPRPRTLAGDLLTRRQPSSATTTRSSSTARSRRRPSTASRASRTTRRACPWWRAC